MNAIAKELNLDPEVSRQLPQTLVSDAFFTKLAEYGITPRDSDELAEYWELGEKLTEQTAKLASNQERSVLKTALAMVNKHASKPQGEAVAHNIADEAAAKTAMYLNNPEVFGHGLVLLTDSNK